jgi:RNA recognition motif-containing protein
MFDPFGEIENVEIPLDKKANFAVIRYCKHKDAKHAVKKMNGF